MKIYTFKSQQTVKRGIKELFSFFESPENLSKLTPQKLGFSMLTPSTVIMREGLVIDYTIKIFGVPLRWTTYISEYAPPHRFADLQLRGPYSYWHHTHRFFETEDGTLIDDEIRYVLPFGFLGDLAYKFFVKKQLEEIFRFRHEAIASLFKD